MSAPAATEPTATVYLDRDLSWLEFNRRVLHEALDARTPLLERVKFLAIFSSNLDEFVMKRVGAAKAQVGLEVAAAPGADARARLQRIRQAVLPLLAAQAEAYRTVIRPELARNGIFLLSWPELNDAQRQAARQYYRRNVFPVLTPLAVDPGHPFPMMSNLSTSLGILLRAPESDERLFARVKVPNNVPQWMALPDDRDNGRPGPRQCFVRLLDVIRYNLDDLFPGMTVLEVMPFRLTRSAVVEADDDAVEADTLAEMVEEAVRQRRFERVVRLEYAAGGSAAQLSLLTRKLDLTETDLYEMPAELDFTDLFPIGGLSRPELRDPPC